MFAQLEKKETTYYAICVGEAVKDKDARLHRGEARQKPSWSIIIISSSPGGLACQSPDIFGAAIAIRLH